jgi:hypothetical protein
LPPPSSLRLPLPSLIGRVRLRIVAVDETERTEFGNYPATPMSRR